MSNHIIDSIPTTTEKEIDNNRDKIEVESVYSITRENILSEISDNILTYAQSVKYINEKIQHLELDINLKKKRVEFDEKIFEEIKQDLKIEEYKYQYFTNEFNTLVNSIEKLIYQYQYSMEEKEYKKNLKREKRELQKYIDKIESVELKLLNQEKEKLIIEKKLEPQLHEIENLEISLEYLKNEKTNNEFKGLLSLSKISTNSYLGAKSGTDNGIIDIELEQNIPRN
ncbi:MAG: hypothetical protein KAU90_07675, partial [Sulfurovaceae bacterium]|nr:hypothetical protein [Sulfurovaceae bacterium]